VNLFKNSENLPVDDASVSDKGIDPTWSFQKREHHPINEQKELFDEIMKRLSNFMKYSKGLRKDF
tara:strand:+ start:37 stop:231 length:195 start_codon:yes stop_codon:yes gene_type:complete